MKTEKLKKFAEELFVLCEKHGASIDDSRISFKDSNNQYAFLVFGMWPVHNEEDRFSIYKINEKEIK